MKHVMVDLETLGTVPGCVILSIGAVEFDCDSGTLGKEFYAVVNRASCEEAFLSVDPETEKWWMGPKNTEASRAVLTQAGCVNSSLPLRKALEAFNEYLLSLGGLRSIRLYGNGADFDNPILRVAYDAAKLDFMGSKAGFFGGRCYRTLKSLDELLGAEYAAGRAERGGTHHNALDDAKTQARHLIQIVQRIRGR